MPSAVAHPDVVSAFVTNEHRLNRILGPLPESVARLVQCNRLGVVPKGHTPGKWRLITDLSFPSGRSVNDGIDPTLCSLSYVSVDTVSAIVSALGTGSLLAKIDIEAAYRLVPVHPDDRPLLGLRWNGEVYCDAMLPFGLRSAAKIFNALADALEWTIRQKGATHIAHYLDDFVIVGAPDSSQCADSLNVVTSTCRELGVPLSTAKCEGPTTRLTFLGIELDTMAGTLRLPSDKLSRVQAVLQAWGDKKTCLRRELESLVGLLHHACKVVRPGRAFCRRMINLLSGASRGHHRIRLGREFRADLAWWRMFVAQWNGIGLAPSVCVRSMPPLYTDASGSWGCGASWNQHWFQLKWDERSQSLPITVKEMLPIVISAAIWGPQWRAAKQVACCCDNAAVVAALSSRSCKVEHIMHLMRCLFYVEAYHEFTLHCTHLPGSLNTVADALSRNALPSFRLQMQEADPLPYALLPRLIDALLRKDLDWLSPTWTAHFTFITRKD